MGSHGPARRRGFGCVAALAALAIATLVTLASASGPGGWDHLGDRGTPGSDSLDLAAAALAVAPGALYVGGDFTDAGGIPNADRIATWNGNSWNALSSSTSQISNGRVSAIALSAGKVYAGGSFQNAGGDGNADNLAVWDGTSWKPFCVASGPAVTGNVTSLQIIGPTLYIGGEFQNGAGIPSADYLLACSLATGAPTSPVGDPLHPFSGSVYALTADSNGTLYAGGAFIDLEEVAAADNVAVFDGTAWHPVGSDGAGNGPWLGNGLALALVDRRLYAAGTFTSAGGDNQARSAASFALAQIIAYPTPTVTQGPGPVPTPTVTPAPAAPDVTAPATSLRRTRLNHAARKATFRFGSGESGSTFACKLDRQRFRACTSPKTYRKLKRGKHVFRVKARDRAGNLDSTPVVKRFKIRRR